MDKQPMPYSDGPSDGAKVFGATQVGVGGPEGLGGQEKAIVAAARALGQAMYDGVGVADAILVLIELVEPEVDKTKPVGGFAGAFMRQDQGG